MHKRHRGCEKTPQPFFVTAPLANNVEWSLRGVFWLVRRSKKKTASGSNQFDPQGKNRRIDDQ